MVCSIRIDETKHITKISLADPDGDSQMHLSSSSDAGDSDMFPTANDPPVAASQTVFDGPALNPMTSELSPPHSQETPQPNGNLNQDLAMNAIGSQDIVAEHGVRLPSFAALQEQKSDFAKSTETTHEPGAAWNNKKSREEWQRAYNTLEDKPFSLSNDTLSLGGRIAANRWGIEDFGDPFDETQGTGNNKH